MSLYMKSRNFNWNLLTLLMPLFLFPQQHLKHKVESKRPNVIIFFADQFNKNVMGFEGHPDVITPNLDKLAKESMIFDRAYCTTGVCVPSRSSLLTGLYPRTIGLLSNEGHTSVMDNATSMATIFKQNNYNTYAFGKRHVKGAIDKGWDIKKGHAYDPCDNDNYVNWIKRMGYDEEFARDWGAEFGRGPKNSPEFKSKIKTADLGTRPSELPDGYTMEAYTAQETIKMIKDQAKSKKPFFCWASFYRPHQPYTPVKKYMDMYDVSSWGKGNNNGSGIKKPESFYEPTGHLPPLLQRQRNGGSKVWNMDKAFENEQLWRNYIGAYYALVTEVDHYIGEITKTLKEEGLENETIIIFTADHGDFVGNHGMVEKAAAGQNVYEDILNIPLMVKIPGKTDGTHTTELVNLADVLPTLIDILGLKKPKLKYSLQGKSMKDVLLDNGSMNRSYLVSESWSQASVITKDYKLGIMIDPTIVHKNRDYRDFGDMFFDRKSDPLEIHNEINNKDYKNIIKTLRGYYEAFKAKIPDTGKQERIEQELNTNKKEKRKKNCSKCETH